MSSSDTDSRSNMYRASSPSNGRSISSRVEVLASTLQDTNKNLRDVDRLLEEYKDIGDRKRSTVNKLKDELNRTSEEINDERMKRASNGQYQSNRRLGSPVDNDLGPLSDRIRSKPPVGTIRFFDDMHDVHKSVRDLTSDQWKMERDLNDCIMRTNRLDQSQSNNGFSMKSKRSIDDRLRSLQAEIEASNKSKQSDVNAISEEVRKTIERELGYHENAVKPKFEDLDTHKSVIEELKGALQRGENEKQRLIEHLQDAKLQISLLTREKQFEDREVNIIGKEKERLEGEISVLKNQISKSMTAVSSYSDVRKALDASEKQRQQLSDLLQNLKVDLEKKEKECSKYITQLQLVNEKLTNVQRDHQKSCMEVDELTKKNIDLTKTNESTVLELFELKSKLQETDHKKNEIKVRAQETVRQWKYKCKQLENEVNVYKSSTETGAERTKELMKELQISQSQLTLTAQQQDHIKREFSQLLAIRAQQEEELRIKDIQINESKSIRDDLDREVRDLKMMHERIELELTNTKEKLANALDERIKFEDQTQMMQSNIIMSQNQAQQWQKEIKELSIMRVELASQVADLANQKQEIKMHLKEVEHKEAVANEELQMLKERFNQEKLGHAKEIEALKLEFDQCKSLDSRKYHEIARQRLREKAEYEAHTKTLKIELDEAKTESKLNKKQIDTLRLEFDKISKELIASQEQVASLQIKYLDVKEEIMSKTSGTIDGFPKTEDLEHQLFTVNEELNAVQYDYKRGLMNILSNIDAVIQVCNLDDLKYMNFTEQSSVEGIKSMFADILAKLAWLHNAVKIQDEKNQILQNKLKEDYERSENGRMVLLRELHTHQSLIQQLNSNKELPIEVQLNNLNDADNFNNDSAITEESELKRDLIKQRYEKLQETMANLRKDLVGTPSSTMEKKFQKHRSRSVSPVNKHVRIQSPPRHDRNKSPSHDVSHQDKHSVPNGILKCN